MRGRKPKPTVLVNLHGRTSGGRAPRHDEPVPVGDLSEPPIWLTNDQKENWRYALEYAPAGLLKRIDRTVLTVWVVAEDTHRQASMQLAKAGLLVKASSDPESTAPPIQNPLLGIMNRQALILLKAASELGFSPVSRPRIGRADGTHIPVAAPASGKERAKVPLREYLANAPTRGLMN